jgi:hypothetical protein
LKVAQATFGGRHADATAPAAVRCRVPMRRGGLAYGSIGRSRRPSLLSRLPRRPDAASRRFRCRIRGELTVLVGMRPVTYAGEGSVPPVEGDATVEIALGEAVVRLERVVRRVESIDGPPLTWDELGDLSSMYEHVVLDADTFQHLLRRLRTALREHERRSSMEAVQAAKAARASN